MPEKSRKLLESVLTKLHLLTDADVRETWKSRVYLLMDELDELIVKQRFTSARGQLFLRRVELLVKDFDHITK